jgi:hypothetical protein
MAVSNTLSLGEPPLSEEQISAIADQLERVLSSSCFRTSQRCSTLLRHVVEAAIQGRGDELRERKIGVNAFCRERGYDSDTDPVVRIVAGDVRRRIAQYYGDADVTGQIRIELPVGAYVPVFHFPPREETAARQPQMESSIAHGDARANIGPAAFADGTELPSTHRFRFLRPRRWVKPAFAAIIVLLAIAGGAWLKLRPSTPVSGFDTFWAPVVSAQQRVLICYGELYASNVEIKPNSARSRNSVPWTVDLGKQFPNGIPIVTARTVNATANIAGVFGGKKKAFDILGESNTNLNDLMNRPVILIGSNSNDWTIRSMENMRFRFDLDLGQRLSWISDREKPTEKIGGLFVASPDPATFEAFAIVARDVDPTTGAPLVVLAGVTGVGSAAAAEFVSEPNYLNDFARNAPKGWERKNLEFLITAPVVDNVVGHPRIVAYQVW